MTTDRPFSMIALRCRQSLLLLALGLFVGNALAQSAVGTVMAVTGSVVATDTRGVARELVKGGEVRVGDRVVTADGALAQVRTSDGGYLSIRSGTEMVFDKFQHDAKEAKNSNFVLSLVRGGLRSITGLIGRNNPDAYQINTPTATIGIRGTDHEPMFIPVGMPALPGVGGELPVPGSYDKVNSGETFLRNELGTVVLKPGQVGFSPVKPVAAPQTLAKIPEFYKVKVEVDDAKDDDDAPGGERKPAAGAKSLRPTAASRLGTLKDSGGSLSTLKDSGTLSTAKELVGSGIISKDALSTSADTPTLNTSVLKSSTLLNEPVIGEKTLSPTLSPTTSTLIAPTTTTVTSPTTSTLNTTSTLISPTLSTTTLSAPKTTTTTAPTTSTTTSSPTSTSTILTSPLYIKR